MFLEDLATVMTLTLTPTLSPSRIGMAPPRRLDRGSVVVPHLIDISFRGANNPTPNRQFT